MSKVAQFWHQTFSLAWRNWDELFLDLYSQHGANWAHPLDINISIVGPFKLNSLHYTFPSRTSGLVIGPHHFIRFRARKVVDKVGPDWGLKLHLNRIGAHAAHKPCMKWALLVSHYQQPRIVPQVMQHSKSTGPRTFSTKLFWTHSFGACFASHLPTHHSNRTPNYLYNVSRFYVEV